MRIIKQRGEKANRIEMGLFKTLIGSARCEIAILQMQYFRDLDKIIKSRLFSAKPVREFDSSGK